MADDPNISRRKRQARCVRGSGFFVDALDDCIGRYNGDDDVDGMIIDMEIALEKLKAERENYVFYYGKYRTGR